MSEVRRASQQPLFRPAAAAAMRTRLLGRIHVIAPPSMRVAIVIAVLCLGLLAAAAYAVEIPQRVRAKGVLMPSGGLHTVAAMQSGRVRTAYVREGDRVQPGDVLVTITADRSMPGTKALHAERLSSLRRENELLSRKMRQREQLATLANTALPEELRLAGERLAAAQEELHAQQQRQDLQRHKLSRFQSLALAGNLSVGDEERVRAELLLIVAGVAALEQRVAQFELELNRLLEQQKRLAIQEDLEVLSSAAQLERLTREMRDTESRISEDVIAPASGVITRANFAVGAQVAAGEALMSWHSPDDTIEAWIYVPAADAGQLAIGQQINLRFDAFPVQIFGTQAARINFISSTALMPSELDVPLVFREPVFEVRASIDASANRLVGKAWPSWPGTSFSADIVQYRLRLYEWLSKDMQQGS